MSERADLKPCPFCGGEAVCREYDDRHPCEPFGLVVNHATDCFLSLHTSHDQFQMRWNTRASTANAERIAALEGEVERLRIAEVAANQRAALAEDRLYSFRQGRASTGKALAEFIKARAPDLWPDYAAISVNKSVYSDDYVQEPTWEREMNILRHRVEKAEGEAAALRAVLKGTDNDPE